MWLSKFYKVSRASVEKVPQERVQSEYKRLRNRTFWGAAVAYSLYYVCRMSLSVVKQPLIDDGLLTPGQLGLIGSAFLFVYAVGKFMNGFIADYCNIRRFMATGLAVSAIVNLIMGLAGLLTGFGSVIATIVFSSFALFWGINGWAQSMGSPPGIITLSRWFPLKQRGTFYSIFAATPYVGESLSFIVVAFIVGALGWQFGFMIAAIAGILGTAIILIFCSDTPESRGLPSVQELSGEAPRKEDSMPTSKLQKMVLRHPGIWVIALSSAFVYIVKYAIANWGILFLQKVKDFSLESAATIIGTSAIFGVLGTVLAGVLSDYVIKGNRGLSATNAGAQSVLSLALFLFTGGGYVLNLIYISVFSLSIGVLYCIVAGLMALDIVPRKATGAALGVVGISSYVAAGIQDIATGYLIEGYMTDNTYNFTPVSIFWIVALLFAFLLPVSLWRKLKVYE